MTPPTVARPRQARSTRNTEQILAAALDACVEEGWSSMLTQRVAARCGLAGPTVRGRFPDRSRLAATLWSEQLAEPTIDALRAVVDACPSTDTKAAIDPKPAFRAFTHPDRNLRASAELMIVSLFDPLVHEAVDSTLGSALSTWLRPSEPDLTEFDAARHGYALSLALGLLVQGLATPLKKVNVGPEVERRWASLGRRSEPPALPVVREDLWDEPIRFDTGDRAWDAVLRATMHEVGVRGYEAATIAAIAEASGYTQGAIFSRYATKRELFLDATKRMVEITSPQNEAFQLQLIDEFGPGVAEAIIMKGFMKPSRRIRQVVNLEQFRLAWHDAELQSAIRKAIDLNVAQAQRQPETVAANVGAWVHCEYSLGVGTVMLGALFPDAAKLPYHAVTVPLLEG